MKGPKNKKTQLATSLYVCNLFHKCAVFISLIPLVHSLCRKTFARTLMRLCLFVCLSGEEP